MKKEYRQRLLAKVVVFLSIVLKNYKLLVSKLPQGRRGLDYGFPPNVLDAARLIKENWDAVSCSTIAACWARSPCVFTEGLGLSDVILEASDKEAMHVGSLWKWTPIS